VKPPSPKATASRGLAVLAAVVIIFGALQLTRPGYSVDEEFTVFAVRGIEAHGLPILPSGLLYDRGVAYSYAAWMAHAVTGSELPAYRALSLLSAALCVMLTFFLVRRVAGDPPAIVASLLIVVPLPFWATATTARFYAPFLGAYLLSLYLLTHRHWWMGLIAAAALARLTHELAFTLAVIPAICWCVAAGDRRHWLRMTLAVAAGLIIGQLVLLGMHFAAPASGDTMVRRFFLWQVLNLFERPGERQFAIPIVVMVMAWIVWPQRARLISVVALALAAATLSYSVALASNTAPMSLELMSGVAEAGSRYPLDMFWYLVRHTPIAASAALLLLAYRARHEWPPRHRAAQALWVGWVLWFGVIDSGITTNYLLLPITFLMIAIAVDALSIRLPRTAIWVLLILVSIDQWRGTSLAAARPTITAAGLDDIRRSLQPNDRIVCTDELGCMMLVGRIDRWLALDDFVRERFLVRRGDGPVSGVYTGVPAVMRPAEALVPNDDGTWPERILVVDIFKEYPIGNSRSWLPRAIEQDGVRAVTLIETPQWRVLQISAPEAVAAR
jgi:hypothetical protein